MSVVNKMLQDLESRKKQDAISADYVPASKVHSKKRLTLWMLVLPVAMLSSALLLIQSKWFETPAETQLTQATFTQTLPLAADTRAEPATNAADEHAESAKPKAVLAHTVSAHEPSETKVTKHEDTSSNTALISQAQPLDSALPAQVSFAEASIKPAASQDTDMAKATDDSEFSKLPSSGAKMHISALREKARIALSKDDPSTAMSALDTLVSNYPQDIRARKQLASLLFSHHAVEKAEQVLSDGLALAPSDSAMRIMLARVAYKTGDFQDAFLALTAHPYPELADTELISFRAALAERLSRYESAQEDYQRLITREPKNAKWWLGLGVSQDKLKLPQDALNAYQQARALNQLPTDVNSFVEQRIAVLRGQS